MHPSVFDFDFAGPPALDGALVPPPDQWPSFDAVLACSFSPSPDSSPSESPSPSVRADSLPFTLPSSAELAAMPIPPSRTSSRNKDPNHIPRPRNAFMLFRSAFAAAQKITSSIEHDNRHITRIIAHCWNHLSEAEKQVWRDKAAAEKVQHAERYPNYRFSPVGRANRPVKRNVRRNGAEDVKRCEKLAELVMAGKCGQELESAIKKIDNERLAAAHAVNEKPDVSANADKRGALVGPDRHTMDAQPSVIPPFRSPLLPPVETASQQASEKVLVPEPLVHATAVCHVEPPPNLSPALSDGGLEYLFGTPYHQYYEPNGVPCLKFEPFQSVMRFVQSNYTELEQSAPDYSLLTWNPSDSFSFYH